MSNCSESHLEFEAGEEDVDEEEDVDFNPFLKESPSLEASSSLSSDVGVLDADLAGQVQDYTHRNAVLGKEIVTVKKRKADLISQLEVETLYMRENCTSSGMDVINSNVARDTTQSGNGIINLDEEDAICRRTRARYSLASFTLDELETFLQESDDDDEPYNVDDEEEYKKFLAAVLQDGGDNCQIRQDNENVEDEDEENDADFELELEEALESDLEENCRGDTEGLCGTSRRPETRLNRCQKASTKEKSRLLGQSTKPLRPLLPNTPVVSFPTLIPETVSGLSIYGCSLVNGFTHHQWGQLHCLIHEHVQLLIQVFSLCVLDPSRQQIASQVRDLILELLKTREWLMSCRQAPSPFFGFYPLAHPSGSYVDEQKESSGNNSRPFPQAVSPSTERCGCAFNMQDSCWQTNGPIVSVLDVAPLSLVGKYMEEVSMAVQEYQQRQIQSGSPSWLKSEPLFPFHNSQCLADAEVVRGSAEDEPIKKTLAGVLVERTKKQSVAFVPKEVAVLAQRFLPLFNPALFPHKPPPATVANRVLFTDAEDELLALGLMEYNTNWKAIQQHFLPCKSKHQIFVRQKNRSSAKAPENPIKVVRKMKSSPLTKEEIARIKEGLKVFKLDWMSVWRYVVPYRDPSLLPRQWRIANGTQKSYKSSAEKNEKRRLRDKNRKRCKPATLASRQTSSGKEECQTDNAGGENNSGDDRMGNEGEAYVHEAFLADWRPVNSSPILPSLPLPSLTERCKPPCAFLSVSGSHVIEQTKNSGLTDQNPSASGSTSRHGNPQLVPRTYRSRKKKNECLVKLAPDLPPINLPASVRVMSQSVFASLNRGKEIPVKSSFIRNGSQHHSESRAFKDENVARGIINKPDLQMHPLLFQPSADRHLPYYQQSCGNSTSISFNFLSPFQPQLNLSFLPNPHLVNQADNHFDKSSKEPTTAGGIDFHPLLQKANDVTTNYVMGHRLTQLPTNSESLRSGSAQRHTEPLVENSSSGNLTESSNVNGNANELELDIHLSLSRQEFPTGIRDVDQPSEHHSPASLGQNRSFANLNSDAQLMGVWSESITMHGTSVGDQSLPGIVMEQEELSDSEEEIGEHVDFECEEMDDSEGDEGSGSEHVRDLQNKELANSKVEVVIVTAKGKEKTNNPLGLNLNSFPKLSESNSNMTGSKHSLGKEGTQTKSDVIALKTSKGPTKGATRNKTSCSNAGSSRKGDFNLNAEHMNSTAWNTGPLRKVDSNLNEDVNVENYRSV